MDYIYERMTYIGEPENGGLKIWTKAKCVDCNRVFDLSDTEDAEEWYYGHDCEV